MSSFYDIGVGLALDAVGLTKTAKKSKTQEWLKKRVGEAGSQSTERLSAPKKLHQFVEKISPGHGLDVYPAVNKLRNASNLAAIDPSSFKVNPEGENIALREIRKALKTPSPTATGHFPSPIPQPKSIAEPIVSKTQKLLGGAKEAPAKTMSFLRRALIKHPILSGLTAAGLLGAGGAAVLTSGKKE